MPAPRKYDQETRDRAVRMYQEHRRAHRAEFGDRVPPVRCPGRA